MKRVCAETEKGFDLAAVKDKVEKSFKEAELEMSNNVRCHYCTVLTCIA